jgi:hypothetical protein
MNVCQTPPHRRPCRHTTHPHNHPATKVADRHFEFWGIKKRSSSVHVSKVASPIHVISNVYLIINRKNMID